MKKKKYYFSEKHYSGKAQVWESRHTVGQRRAFCGPPRGLSSGTDPKSAKVTQSCGMEPQATAAMDPAAWCCDLHFHTRLGHASFPEFPAPVGRRRQTTVGPKRLVDEDPM